MKALPKVADFMDTVVPTLNPETRIIEAVDFLLHHRVTGAPVVDAGGKIVGSITRFDLLRVIRMLSAMS